MDWHHLKNSKHFMLPGNPASRKHAATWMVQAETASKQSPLLLKGGRGAEHQFPHVYSQVGVAVEVIVFVQREAVVLVGVFFVDVLFADVLFADVLFVDVLLVDVLLVDVLLVDVLFVDVLFFDVVLPEVVVGDVVGKAGVVKIFEEVVRDIVVVREVVVDEVHPQGWLDPKSCATYTSSANEPPQVSEASPLQAISQSVVEIGTVPFPRTAPQ